MMALGGGDSIETFSEGPTFDEPPLAVFDETQGEGVEEFESYDDPIYQDVVDDHTEDEPRTEQ